jgi:hypothetical protein
MLPKSVLRPAKKHWGKSRLRTTTGDREAHGESAEVINKAVMPQADHVPYCATHPSPLVCIALL